MAHESESITFIPDDDSGDDDAPLVASYPDCGGVSLDERRRHEALGAVLALLAAGAQIKAEDVITRARDIAAFYETGAIPGDKNLRAVK